MRYSLITGDIRVNHKAKPNKSSTSDSNITTTNNNNNNNIEQSFSITPRNNHTQLTTISNWSPASNFLQNRIFVGLEPKIGETPVTKAVEGRAGIPMNYGGEGQEEGENTNTIGNESNKNNNPH